MINQPPGSLSSSQQTQPLATSVQIRQNLALKQLDHSQELIINSANQPLSPTHSSMTTQAKNQTAEQKATQGKIRELKGTP